MVLGLTRIAAMAIKSPAIIARATALNIFGLRFGTEGAAACTDSSIKVRCRIIRIVIAARFIGSYIT